MSMPKFQELMLPVLKLSANNIATLSDIVDSLAIQMHIPEEDLKKRNPGGSNVFYSRVAWAKSYLLQAGLVKNVKRGQFTVTQAGLELLNTKPTKIDTQILKQYSCFNDFLQRCKKTRDKNTSDDTEYSDLDELSPEEAIHKSLENLNFSMATELLNKIITAKPDFFEKLIIKLLVAMGYSNNTDGDWKHTGKPGDDGVDGIINQDELGVDKIYIQAKRYSDKNTVSSQALRDFIGALDLKKATKGIFVTTSTFTPNAKNTVALSSKNIVLIDGEYLTQLMIKYSVGCKVKEMINIQKIDDDFFEEF